jgi:hypothetical protein
MDFVNILRVTIFFKRKGRRGVAQRIGRET